MNEWFLKPENKYRGIPFWSWNCKVTKEQIDHDLDVFEKMGFGGVDIHPRVGLDTEYLGDEFMELVHYTVEQCKKRGLVCWLYDDDRYPSGAADGFVTKKMEYRDRGLFLTVTPQKQADETNENGYCKNRETFEQACREGKKPAGYFVGVYVLHFANRLLQNYQYLTDIAQIESAENAREAQKAETKQTTEQTTEPEKTVLRYAYVKLARESVSFEGQTYIDTLNPEAVKEFIRITHERYNEKVGNEFGKTVEAIFTDEPRIGKQSMISSADSSEDFEIPYSEAFETYLKKHTDNDTNHDTSNDAENGIDNDAGNNIAGKLLEIVPELIWDLPDGRHAKSRYQYRNALAECFAQSYMDQICEWCWGHGIFMTGHVLAETPLIDQTATVGECMRSYRKMDIPGFDVLCDDECFVAAKQSVSVSRQMGRAGTVSEMYGVTGWDCSFETYKRQADWQAALGVTRRVPHLSFMSMGGEAKRDWPASISFQSPWHPEFSYIEDHFARVNAALSQGQVRVNVAVLHPIESIWLHMGQADRNRKAAEEIDATLEQITRTLLFDTIDFDYLSESLMPQQNTSLADGALKVGQMCYHTVVIPSMDTIRSTTLAILEQFHQKGGRIVFAGHVPYLVDAEPSDRAAKLAAQCEIATADTLLETIRAEKEIVVTDQNGQPSRNLFCQYRETENGRWLFFCNARKQPCADEVYTICVKGRFHVKCYDTQTGEITDMDYACTAEKTSILWHAYGQDSILLKLERIHEQRVPLTNPDQITLEEDNVFLLDYAQAVLDEDTVCSRKEILKLDDEIRNILGYERRDEHMLQPWATEKRESHNLVLKYEFESAVQTRAKLALELPDACEVYLNGVAADMHPQGYYVDPAISVINLPDAIKVGTNELLVKLSFHQKTNLEAMYLLGSFGVSLKQDKTVLVERSPLTLGDITKQSLPFYTGNIWYNFTVQIEQEGTYALCVPKYNAPVLTAYVDKKKIGAIVYAPYRIALGILSEGTHTISICMFGNRNNAFGAVHNPNEYIRWNGPKAYRTTGADWTDEYRVKPVGIEKVYLVTI